MNQGPTHASRLNQRGGETVPPNPQARPLLAVGRWKIFRLDERNFVLTANAADEDAYRYYPTLRYAVGALLEENIHEAVRPGLESIRDAIRQAESTVLAALSGAVPDC